MIIATRVLKIQDVNLTVDVPIDVYAPERKGADWICRFHIGWPNNKIEQWGMGGDGIDAVFRALQMIGALLYTSTYHQQRRLFWIEPGTGYGFPVPNNIRDMLEGIDIRAV
jgi:hypothetical protein